MKRTRLQAFMEDLKLTEEHARRLLRAIAGKLPEQEEHDTHEAVDFALEVADEVMGGFGVESITVEGAYVDSFYYNIVALYVNMGETYQTTLVYDTEREVFYRTSWGSWVESQEANGRYQFA